MGLTMLKVNFRILFALALLAPMPAFAQQAPVLANVASSCGGQTYTAGVALNVLGLLTLSLGSISGSVISVQVVGN